ncbi:glucosyltransferase domain-containing protein [Serratia sp. P2ACOL2]|uniref:glucosyltransferase domain-containing protein n=1 Tax=Serratia sp. P2ACOL2 TaxID=2482769 RepID=UPI000EFB7E45|nr:glucosyltransferase domain-containing protein [Serratia sp. P2ACOL2]AYO37456.1 hypothetical protein EBA31_09200 [Serratia sp. P2ACOL2]
MICKNDKKTLALYSGLALLFIYPLIQSGVFYRDDLDRAITGQYGWRGLGRPMADILMKILSASGHYNLDLFPYTMIMSCLFIGASSLLLKKHLTRMDVQHPVFVAAFLIFNPYMLQNIAYRYDSLGMALAFFLSVLAYTYSNTNQIREVAVKIVSGVLALTLYQPCANIFIGLLAADVFIFGLKNHLEIHHVTKLVARKACEFISFYIIYMLLFSTKSNSRSELITPDTDGYRTLVSTVKSLYEIVASYFHGPVYIYFLIPTLFLIALLIKKSIKNNNLISTSTLAIISTFIFLTSLLGPTIFLRDSPVFPRTLISFSVLFVIIATSIVELAPKIKHLALIPLITAFAFSAQLSSAMKSQREYEDFVFNMISRDIINHPDVKLIGTTGQVNINERARLLMDNKPLIGYFLSPASEFLASFQLINKGLPQTLHGYGDEQSNKNKLAYIVGKGIKPFLSNKDYSLYFFDNEVIVSLGYSKN